MKQFMVVLWDSFRQALDRKILIVLLILALLPIVFCFSISFKSRPLAERIDQIAQDLGRFEYRGWMHSGSATHGTDFSVGEVRAIQEGKAPSEDFHGGHELEITFSSLQQLDWLVRSWNGFQERWKNFPKGGERAEKGRDSRIKRDIQEKGAEHLLEAGTDPVSPQERIEFLEARFRSEGFNHVHVESGEEAPAKYRISLATDYPQEVRGARKLELFFGLQEVPLEEVSTAEFVLQLELGLSSFFAGFLVMVVAVWSTASFIPDMLSKGTLDLLLARPVGRTRLLLYKYLGGLWFIAIFAVFLIGGCWLALAVQTGISSPWFLCSILTLLAIFAVLYSVSVFTGILTRSTGFSILVTLGIWGVSSILVDLRHGREMLFGEDMPEVIKTGLEVFYIILPNTKDLGYLNFYALSQAQLSSDFAREQILKSVPDVNWLLSLGTTFAFTACMLALAAWRFHKKDY